MQNHEQDGMERLLAQLERVDAPAGFLASVMERVALEPAPRARPAFGRAALLVLAAYLLSLGGLGLLAFHLGMSLAHNGTSVLLSTLLGDLHLFIDQPGIYLSAIGASVPWLEVAAVAADLVVLVALTRLLMRQSARDKRLTSV